MNICLYFAGCLVALACGCSRHQPAIQPITADTVVVAFGDSLTAGTGANPDEAYPAVLGRLLGCKVVNAGVPGELTAKGLERLPDVLAAERPGLVILCHGGNDLLLRVSAGDIEHHLSAMVDVLRRARADVILVSVPAPSLTLAPPDFYRRVARAFGIPCDNAAVRAVLSKPGLKSDEIHPNADGYRLMAESIRDVIVRAQRPQGR